MSHRAAFLAPLVALAAIAVIRWRRVRPAPAASRALRSSATAPDVAHLVNRDVFAAFPAWVAKWEGSTPTMYRDTNPSGLITTGIGNLIDPIDLALSLPWLRPDGTPASQDEIRADWQRVKALPRALFWKKYQTPAALHLAPESIADLVRRHSAGDVKQLARIFADFPTYPAAAQTALLDLAWNMGAGFATKSKWAGFSDAIRRRDWSAAAAEIKGTKARDVERRKLLLSAVGVA